MQIVYGKFTGVAPQAEKVFEGEALMLMQPRFNCREVHAFGQVTQERLRVIWSVGDTFPQ